MVPFEAVMFTGSLWVASYAAFHLFLPVIGVTLSYQSSPIEIALFYLAWCGIAGVTFADVYRSHIHSLREFRSDATLSVLFGIAAGLFLFGFAKLSIPSSALAPVGDLFVATPWYFLPKSFDILFQQLLIAALVLSLGQRFSVRATSIIYTCLFGAAHLLLFLGAQIAPTTYLMLLGAIVSGAFFPYLLLRVRHGFIYTYSIHWAFYAFVVVALRVLA